MRSTILLVALVACTGHDAPGDAATPGAPALGAPTTSIGRADDPEQELYRAWSAVWLGDGRIAVANGRPVALRLYAADGSLAQVVGRLGEGPGEYRGRLDLLTTPGDSLLAFDHGLQRWQLYGPDGRYARRIEADDPRGHPASQLMRGAYIAARAEGDPACGRQLALALGPPDSGWREIRGTRGGMQWEHVAGDPAWHLRRPDGILLGTVTVPADRQVLDVGVDWILLRLAGDGEPDLLTVHPTGLAATLAAPAACEAPPEIVDSAVSEELQRATHDVFMAGERYYGENARYPETMAALRSVAGVTLPDGYEVGIVASSPRGWGIVFRVPHGDTTCFAGIGDAARIGWAEGRPYCAP